MIDLTRTLDELLGHMKREEQQRARFYAAASHELRTPIQSLQGQIDVAQSRRRSVEEHEEVLAQLQLETQRLARLIADLLQLNALEIRQNDATREPLWLTFWIERALAQQTEFAQSRGLQWQTQLEAIEVNAPPLHLETLLRNLMENAARYASQNSEILINVEPIGGDVARGARFRIWNACELSGETQFDNWFEPFYQRKATRDSCVGGNGLGLSIVAALARANDWEVQLQKRDGGVEATVEFARANEVSRSQKYP